METALSTAQKIVEFLKVAGPYAFVVIEGYVIFKLWKRNEELHEKLEKKK